MRLPSAWLLIFAACASSSTEKKPEQKEPEVTFAFQDAVVEDVLIQAGNVLNKKIVVEEPAKPLLACHGITIRANPIPVSQLVPAISAAAGPLGLDVTLRDQELHVARNANEPPRGACPEAPAPAAPKSNVTSLDDVIGGTVSINTAEKLMYVQRVRAGGALEKYGLKAGDVITAVNGAPIDMQGSLALMQAVLDGKGTLRVRRGGTEMEVPLDAKK